MIKPALNFGAAQLSVFNEVTAAAFRSVEGNTALQKVIMEARGGPTHPHVAVLPSPGMGHFIPFAEFSKRLVLHHSFTVTFITSSDFSSHAQTAFLDALPADLSCVTLPSTSLDDFPGDARLETRLCVMVARSLPHLRDVLRRLKETTRLAAPPPALPSLSPEKLASRATSSLPQTSCCCLP